ncbi:MAG: efflux RND transporter permease subunit [Gemmataceae bacterium]|nr:efflux RND transporter permease subunit [Gemmataceae bacterium]
MAIWDVCIRRPVFTTMLVAVPVVLGLFSYFRLGVDLFPDVDIPIVIVTTTMRGAGVEEMETSITRLIEETVNTVSGIDELRSTTREGISQVVIQFKVEKNGPMAAQEIDAKVQTLLNQLPLNCDPPIIDRFDISASPVLSLAISGRRDIREVTHLAKKNIKEQLENLSGVGTVTLVGGRVRAIQVILDPDKMQKYPGLTIAGVRKVLSGENQEMAGGRVEQGQTQLTLRTLGRVANPEAISRLIVDNRNGAAIRIGDIARVEDSFEEPQNLSRIWNKDEADPLYQDTGQNAVTLFVQKQTGVNTVQVVDRVLARIQEIQPALPPDIRLQVIRDQSRFIRGAIDEIKRHGLMAVLLVSMTILLFIRDMRTTAIAALSIPASIVGTFALMDFLGLTLNNMTILGLILAVGIVIDDAVVVHENIYRFMEEKKIPASQAAGLATREISLAVIATTLSLLVIFLPIVFMGGQVGRFFNSFGMVIAFAILMSLFVSLTLTPMLCSRFLRVEENSKGSKSGWIWRFVENSYIHLLKFSLNCRWLVVVVSVGLVALTPWLMGVVGMEFVPRDDQGEFQVAILLPEGYSLERSEAECLLLEKEIRKFPSVVQTYTVVGDTTSRLGKGQGDISTANIYVRLTDLKQRKFSQFDVMKQVRGLVGEFPEFRASVQDVSAFQETGFRQVMIDLNIRGPEIEKLKEISLEMTEWMKTHPFFVDIDTSLTFRKPELRIIPDRDRLSDLGVSLENLSATVNILVGGEPVGKYKEEDEQYDIWLRAEKGHRLDAESISRLPLPSAKEGVSSVEIGNVASFAQALGPAVIERFSRQRQVVISANLEGMATGPAVDLIKEKLSSLELPPTYQWEFIGQAKLLADQISSFIIAFNLSFLFMYMVLAAQFESFVHPVSILLSLPLTIPFALLSLLIIGSPLDIYAMFGLFMLFGIVKKNGILQIDYTNQIRRQGVDRTQAILEANRTRFRPILMTTVMLIAAMVPMALGQGHGAASRAGLAKIIMGGQALSLLLTLLLTPVAYSLLDDFGIWCRRRFHKSMTSTETGP